MKILYLVLKASPSAQHCLEALRHRGFNGTVVAADSLRSAVEEFPEDHHFYNLRHYEKREILESILCFFVLKEEELEDAKAIIREATENFHALHGFMFSKPLEDYEGSI